jgi:transglutaminase-like putative cysteine protease
MRGVSFVLVFLLLISFVSGNELNSYDNVKVKVDLDSSVNLNLESGYRLDYFTINLSFKPGDYYLQEATNTYYSSPEGELIEDGFWKWEEVEEKIEYGVDSMIDSEIKIYHLSNKVNFPYDFDEELTLYLKNTENINSNDYEIRDKANELVEGKDDLYEAVFEVGNWVNHEINYDLSTLTADVTQNASWTFQNKYGVCDEITTLFVAMLRSVGIPAKFVSGIAYTDAIDGFGSHAWSEVYFPNIGWVPFDITYGQYGYVDSTHIKMRESNDPSDPSVTYQWKANGVSVDVGEVGVNGSFLELGNAHDENIDVKINMPISTFKIGSYVPVVIEVKNLDNFYKTSSFYLAKTPVVLNNTRQEVLLKPRETKYFSYIIPLGDDSDPGFIYTSVIEIKTIFNEIYNTTIRYGRDFAEYDLERAQKYIDEFVVVSEDDYNKQVRVECEEKVFYVDEEIKLNCNVENRGNFIFNSIGVCLRNNCEYIHLRIKEDKDITFEPSLALGENILKLRIEEKDIDYDKDIVLKLLEEPKFEISKIEYPEVVNYEDNYEIDLKIDTEDVKNLTVKVDRKIILELDKINEIENIIIPFQGGFFYDNKKELEIDYWDSRGESHSEKIVLELYVDNIPLSKNFMFLGLVSLILLVVLISLLLYIFREKHSKKKKVNK